jgi:hypothetical protein
VLDPRIYRAALLPALLAFVVAAFSIQQPQAPLTTTLPPDSFSGARAFGTLATLGQEFPSRRPGSRGDTALANRVRSELRQGGFRVRDRAFEARTAAGNQELRSVVGTRAGFSERKIVVVAHRDALSRPATAQLSGTAGLIELARVFRGRTLRKTLVLASTSGGSAGNAGAAEVAENLGGSVDAVIVLGDIAGRQVHRPIVVPWSSGDGIAPLELRRTIQGALRLEGDLRPGDPGAFSQFDRQAFPTRSASRGSSSLGGCPPCSSRPAASAAPARSAASRRRAWPRSGGRFCAASPRWTRGAGRPHGPAARCTWPERCCPDGPCAWSAAC